MTMTEFLISIDGERGQFTVDGEQPELFGELVGCNVTQTLPMPRNPRLDDNPIVITPPSKPVVDVTLRLPLGHNDHLTLVRNTNIKTVYGPTGDSETTTIRPEPGPTILRIVTGPAPDVVSGPGWLEHVDVALRGDCVCGEGQLWRAETDGVHIARWLKQHENCTEAASG